MATPNLDAAILKLRRKLGDIYDESGDEIVTGTPGAGQIYLGNSSLRSTWTTSELLDIYNDSVHEFIGYCVKVIPHERLYELMPGFIKYLPAPIAAMSIGGQSVKYVNLDTIVPPAAYILDARDVDWITNQSQLKLGIHISPSRLFSSLTNSLSSTQGQLMYTVISLDAVIERMLVFINLAGSSVELVYIKKYMSLTHGGATDLVGFTDLGLKRIQIFAEVYAQRYRSQEVRDLSDSEKKELIETDIAMRQA